MVAKSPGKKLGIHSLMMSLAVSYVNHCEGICIVQDDSISG